MVVIGQLLTRGAWSLPLWVAVAVLAVCLLVARQADAAQEGREPATGAPAREVTFPLRVSDNGRYLVDARGRPFLLHGDSPWYLVWRLTREEACEYLDDRQAKGFNALLVDVPPYTDTYLFPEGREPGEDRRTQTNRYGDRAFDTPGDFATPNEGYFSHLDWLVREAGRRGFLMLLVCADLGSGGHMWYPDYKANGVEKCYRYGRYLGARYQDFPNVMYVLGGDNDPGDVKEHIEAMARGLEETAPAHLKTYHASSQALSSSRFFHTAQWLDLNLCYGAYETYRLLSDYQLPPTKPCFLGEAGYEGQTWGRYPGAAMAEERYTGTPAQMRRQAYWALLSGACGHLYGSFAFQFTPGEWRRWLDAPGAQQMAHVRRLFESLEWPRLVPEADHHEVLTDGYGERLQTNHAVCAWIPDGSLAVCYLPTARTITVDLGRLKGPARARWFDPTSGSYTDVAGSPFTAAGAQRLTPPARNAAGDSDVVLVLEGARSRP